MSNMDPFDEFEFKPLTDGLGFHKKAVSLKEGLKTTGVLEDEMGDVPLALSESLIEEIPSRPGKKHSFEDVLSALEKTPLQRQNSNELQFTDSLPREKREASASSLDIPPPQMPPPVQSPFPPPEAFKAPKAKKIPTINQQAAVGTRRGAADSPQRRLMPAVVSLPSAFLDGIIVLAFALVFLIALLMVTKVDTNTVLANLNVDQMTQIALGALFLAVMQMYVIISRSFFGRTLGEWTFDLQVGEDQDQKQETYPLRVALRSLLNTVTGLILLPLLSLAFRKDLAGRLSGVQLYRQR